MATLTRRSYAEHRARLGLPGGTLAAVQRAIKSERIAVGADGRIDPAVADRQWLANTNFMHERKPTAPARGLVIEDPLAIELLASGCALVDLVGKIEERLSAVFREVVKRAPDYPSTRWEALYAAWREVPDRLERLQTAAKVAAARLQNEFDDKGRDR